MFDLLGIDIRDWLLAGAAGLAWYYKRRGERRRP